MLPRTGSDALAGLAGAGVLAAAGTAAVIRHRRRH
ncbi:LPXTG cell wall anchor domain-containing protein [uncultured Propionibacterium sp.]|nr:LPXTG cell wall anchor domain-containing protein [uncultured Propionibacterium sp.]